MAFALAVVVSGLQPEGEESRRAFHEPVVRGRAEALHALGVE